MRKTPGNRHPMKPPEPHPSGNPMCDVDTGMLPSRSDHAWPTRRVVKPFVKSAYASLSRGVGCSSEKFPVPLNGPKKSASSVALARQPLPIRGPRNPNVSRVFRTSPPCHQSASSVWTKLACWPLPSPNRASCMNSVPLRMPLMVRLASLPSRTSCCAKRVDDDRHTSATSADDRGHDDVARRMGPFQRGIVGAQPCANDTPRRARRLEPRVRFAAGRLAIRNARRRPRVARLARHAIAAYRKSPVAPVAVSLDLQHLHRDRKASPRPFDDLHDREQHVLTDHLEFPEVRGGEPGVHVDVEAVVAERDQAHRDPLAPRPRVRREERLDITDHRPDLRRGGPVHEADGGEKTNPIALTERLDAKVGQTPVRHLDDGTVERADVRRAKTDAFDRPLDVLELHPVAHSQNAVGRERDGAEEVLHRLLSGECDDDAADAEPREQRRHGIPELGEHDEQRYEPG